MTSKPIGFACDRCRAGKRKCDAGKPVCSLCLRQGRQCIYTEISPRKRKYWDEDYVKGLEAQVQTLLSVLETQNGQLPAAFPIIKANSLSDQQRVDSPPTESTPEALESTPRVEASQGPTDSRSHQAMEELCVMLWRTNIGDGVTIIDDPERGSKFTLNSVQKSPGPAVPNLPASILAYCQNTALLHHFAALFLDNINREHQFTSYASTDFLHDFPYQNVHDVFVHSAIIAVGATFSRNAEASRVGEAFAEFAETLVFTSCRQSPSAKVIQGLSMLSWRSLALGRDHLGWMFISLAAGMCVHLRLHVLALDECEARRLDADDEEIRTFWMFYIIDRTAISILGRNCALPWRRINVPSFSKTLASRTATLTEVAFAGQCELWYLHDRYMDQIFSNIFETLPVSQQVHTLISCQDALNGFHKSVDDRLQLTGNNTPKAVLLFHLAYQMAILISMPPFLRIFVHLKALSTQQEYSGESSLDLLILVLRSLTSAATMTVRLARDYKQGHGFQTPPNPVIIHHLLSAGIVHLMNATSQSPSVRNQSAYWVRQCLGLLTDLQTHWPSRSEKSIKVIRILAQRWHVTSCLPLNMSVSIDTNNRELGIVQDGPDDHQNDPSTQIGVEIDSFWPDNFASFTMDSFSSLTAADMDDLLGPGNQTFGAVLTGLGDASQMEEFSWSV